MSVVHASRTEPNRCIHSAVHASRTGANRCIHSVVHVSSAGMSVILPPQAEPDRNRRRVSRYLFSSSGTSVSFPFPRSELQSFMGGCFSSANHKTVPPKPSPAFPPTIPNQIDPNLYKGDSGGTMALPYAHVDDDFRSLAGRAEGFGRHSIGGLHGSVYCVTTLSDDGHGSLREACRKKEPLWIVFDVSGTIHLLTYLRVSSYKTIDGRGQRIKLTGKGLQLKECEHVIVCNLEFEGGRGHDVDAIQIKPKSRHIWIDRCSLRDYDDGLIDITRESTDITVSRCHFAMHDKTMLIGADSSNITDRCIRVTIHHCFFDGTRQRHPRLRFGRVHLYNNFTRNWGIYAVCASVEAQVLSQCNIYEAGQKTSVFRYMPEKAADREEVMAGWIRSEGDLFLNGAQPCLLESAGVESVFKAHEHYPTWTMEPASLALKEVLQISTGWQPVPRPQVTPPSM